MPKARIDAAGNLTKDGIKHCPSGNPQPVKDAAAPPSCKHDLPVYISRFAITKKDLTAPNVTSPYPNVDTGNGFKIGLRTPRSGHLYVYDETTKFFHHYEIDENGLSTASPWKKESDDELIPIGSREGVAAAYINLPKDSTVHIAYSEGIWSWEMLKKFKNDKKLQKTIATKIDLESWFASKSGAMTFKADEIEKHIEDLKEDADLQWSEWPENVEKGRNKRQVNYPLVHTIIAGMKIVAKKAGDEEAIAAVALYDGAGIASELSHAVSSIHVKAQTLAQEFFYQKTSSDLIEMLYKQNLMAKEGLTTGIQVEKSIQHNLRLRRQTERAQPTSSRKIGPTIGENLDHINKLPGFTDLLKNAVTGHTPSREMRWPTDDEHRQSFLSHHGESLIGAIREDDRQKFIVTYNREMSKYDGEGIVASASHGSFLNYDGDGSFFTFAEFYDVESPTLFEDFKSILARAITTLSSGQLGQDVMKKWLKLEVTSDPLKKAITGPKDMEEAYQKLVEIESKPPKAITDWTVFTVAGASIADALIEKTLSKYQPTQAGLFIAHELQGLKASMGKALGHTVGTVRMLPALALIEGARFGIVNIDTPKAIQKAVRSESIKARRYAGQKIKLIVMHSKESVKAFPRMMNQSSKLRSAGVGWVATRGVPSAFALYMTADNFKAINAVLSDRDAGRLEALLTVTAQGGAIASAYAGTAAGATHAIHQVTKSTKALSLSKGLAKKAGILGVAVSVVEAIGQASKAWQSSSDTQRNSHKISTLSYTVAAASGGVALMLGQGAVLLAMGPLGWAILAIGAAVMAGIFGNYGDSVAEDQVKGWCLRSYWGDEPEYKDTREEKNALYKVMYKPSFEVKSRTDKVVVKISVPSFEQGISEFSLKVNGKKIDATLVDGSYEYTSEEIKAHKLEMYYAPDKDILPDTYYIIKERITLIDYSNSYPYGGMY